MNCRIDARDRPGNHLAKALDHEWSLAAAGNTDRPESNKVRSLIQRKKQRVNHSWLVKPPADPRASRARGEGIDRIDHLPLSVTRFSSTEILPTALALLWSQSADTAYALPHAERILGSWH